MNKINAIGSLGQQIRTDFITINYVLLTYLYQQFGWIQSIIEIPVRDAFRGGNTHANRYFVGKICNDVYSYDIASSYPTQQLTKKFPMKPFKWLDGDMSIERVFMFIGLGYAVVGEYHFTGLRLKNPDEPIPYISLARCEALDFRVDNGRILKAGYLEISLTEIDLEIILERIVNPEDVY